MVSAGENSPVTPPISSQSAAGISQPCAAASATGLIPMRLPWFFSDRKRPKSGGKSRRKKSAQLRVRPLERRRVLNASIQSIAVPAVASEGSLVTASANATGQGQLNYNWTFTQGANTLATGTNPTFNFTPPDDG